MGLGDTSRACKGHPMHIATPTRPHPFPLGDPLLILPGMHLLFGPLHLSIIPSRLATHFNHMLHHSLNGMHHPRGGGPHTTMLQPYCLHHLLNHIFYTLLHLKNPRCLPNQITTWKINRHSKYTMERHPILLMLWRFRTSTWDLGEYSQTTNLYLHLGRVRKNRGKHAYRKSSTLSRDIN